MKRSFITKLMSVFLATVMLCGMLTMAVPAADSTGKPDQGDLSDTLYVAIYKGDGFPGEPAVYGISNYTNFGSDFKTKWYGTFKSDASSELSSAILADMKQGASSGSTKVWGVYDTQGMDKYFLSTASIMKPENELKIIKAIKGSSATLDQYEIVWYVIKYQTSDGWHIDGIVKEKATYSVNYYGNGNTSGSAPTGQVGIVSGGSHTVAQRGNLVQTIDGLPSEFLGWNTRPDGSGTMYQPGQSITGITSNMSLYAIWKADTQYIATVKTYLDDIILDASTIHGEDITLFLGGSDESTSLIALEKVATGTYSAKVDDGTYYVWHEDEDGHKHRISGYQMIVSGDVEELHIYHYSVSYDTDGGSFNANEDPGTENFFKGTEITSTENAPVREGYIFLGWEYDGKEYDPSDIVTSSIDEKVVLTAKWLKTVDVTVNVTIDHKFESSYDDALNREELDVYLTHLPEGGSDYTRTGDVLSFTGVSTNKHNFSSENNVTKYTASTATFTDMPSNVPYRVTTSKSHYFVKEVATEQDDDGNWTINVSLQYVPDSFDLEFSVEMDPSVPAELYPVAVNVKVLSYDADNQKWVLINEHKGNVAGVRVEIDKATGKGMGSYPVWNTDPDTQQPYGYRIEVSSFIYADGTVVHASESDKLPNVVYSDGNYTAEIKEVTGGELYGSLRGAYIDNGTQKGDLIAHITLEKYDVTFDAMGGKVNGKDKDTALDQYYIPDFDGYQPVRDSYTFLGWFLDEDCTKPASEGELLTESITLYAKWKAIQTVSGKVTIAGTYVLDGQNYTINDIDLPLTVLVVLYESGNESSGIIDSQLLNVTWNKAAKLGTSETYTFTGLDEDKTYHIDVKTINFTALYQNEETVTTDNGVVSDDYNLTDYDAVFVSDRTKTFVNVYLSFEPAVYEQEIIVDSSEINNGFRPTDVNVEVLYKAVGQDDSAFAVISQNIGGGLDIAIGNDGFNSVKTLTKVWEYLNNGVYSVYQAKLTTISFGSDKYVYVDNKFPYTVSYGEPTRWNANTNAPTGPLTVYVKPNTYRIYFNFNTDDTVTGMDEYLIKTGGYAQEYVWSYGTTITATPIREGYKFLGWYNADNTSEKVEAVSPDTYGDITVIAKWEKDETKTKDVEYTVEHIIFDGNGYTLQDTETYTDKVWVRDESVITVKDGTLEEKTYAGYKFERMDRNVSEGDSIASGTVIKLYYVVNSGDVEIFEYIVQHIVDGKVVEEKDYVEAIWNGTADKKITVIDGSLAKNTYVGYKFSHMTPENVSAGDGVDNNTVIKLYYVKDDTQTKQVLYHVHHSVGGNIIHYNTFYADVWVNDTTLAVQEGTYDKPEYPGYKYTHCDHDIAVGEQIAHDATITLYYEKDSFGYRVEYYYDGVKDDSKTVTDSAEYLTVIKEYEEKVKDGYIFDKVENLPLTVSEKEDDNVIRVYYVTDPTKVPENPKTSDASVSFLLALAVPALGAVMFARKKKNHR